ncbi:hypothetical protein BJ165DRAFT_1452383 [Panaeolus papilionaceus]|nr:hypothetical protein BJ165DRAFT_1452383 [Panaeolus papilionaceus]
MSLLTHAVQSPASVLTPILTSKSHVLHTSLIATHSCTKVPAHPALPNLKNPSTPDPNLNKTSHSHRTHTERPTAERHD